MKVQCNESGACKNKDCMHYGIHEEVILKAGHTCYDTVSICPLVGRVTRCLPPQITEEVDDLKAWPPQSILAQALRKRHIDCGLHVEPLSFKEVALVDREGETIRLFAFDANVFDLWDAADEYLNTH